jgi:dienelactone hydrolase
LEKNLKKEGCSMADTTTDFFNLSHRDTYVKSIQTIVSDRVAALKKEAFSTAFSQDSERLRKEFIHVLGWPLNASSPLSYPIQASSEPMLETDLFVAQRWSLEILPSLIVYCMSYQPKEPKNDALIIAQHGGGGAPELIGGLYKDSANYNHMITRLLKKGTAVIAPQLLLWNQEELGSPYDRIKIDRTLKQCGGSITGFEVFVISRIIDYFSTCPWVNPEHIGMAGLSYGGMYALYAPAVDTRIKATVSSCWFNDRIQYNWEDYTFRDGLSWLDAEVGTLVLPRGLYIEIGDKDDIFEAKHAKADIFRLQEYAKQRNCEDALRIRVFDGLHEFYEKDDLNLDFLLSTILG